MNTGKRNVLLIDGSAVSQSSIAFFLEQMKYLVNCSSEIESCDEILPALRKNDFDLILINYASCRFDICREINRIKKIFPEMLVLIFNFDHSEFEKIHLLKAGVNVLLPPEASLTKVLTMIRDLKPGEVFLNRIVDEALLKRIRANIAGSITDVTMQEISFIRDCCNGLSHSAIAEKYSRSKSRIDNVFHQIHIKTGCETQVDFIRFALLYRIIDWSDQILVDEAIRKFS